MQGLAAGRGEGAFLGRHHEHVRRHAVALHARLGRLDRLVEAETVALRDRVHGDLVAHCRAHRAARAETLLHLRSKRTARRW